MSDENNVIEHYLTRLKGWRCVLTKQQLGTLRGQALSGNVIGAERGLTRILNECSKGILVVEERTRADSSN